MISKHLKLFLESDIDIVGLDAKWKSVGFDSR